jgi:hypothetical protein
VALPLAWTLAWELTTAERIISCEVKMDHFSGGTMDKKIAGLLGAAAALTTMTGAQAAPAQPTELAPATSYRDLLDPVPNALPMLKADDARLAQKSTADEVAQISVQLGHHHHHHHHVVVVPRRHHHHHHHTVIISH